MRRRRGLPWDWIAVIGAHLLMGAMLASLFPLDF